MNKFLNYMVSRRFNMIDGIGMCYATTFWYRYEIFYALMTSILVALISLILENYNYPKNVQPADDNK